jgi:probable rRNA maturation factor
VSPSQEPPSTGRPSGDDVVVVVVDEQSDHVLDLDRWAQLAERTLRGEGVRRGELTLTFVDEATIAELNREHMDGDGPTDVLSFPLDHEGGPDDLAPSSSVPVLLGDVVVCPAVAARAAADHAAGAAEPHPGHPDHDGTLEAEIDLLVVHGVLHVLGHDHADDDERATMLAAERRHLTPDDGVSTP